MKRYDLLKMSKNQTFWLGTMRLPMVIYHVFGVKTTFGKFFCFHWVEEEEEKEEDSNLLFVFLS